MSRSQGAGGGILSLALHGVSVTNKATECGYNSVPVYFTLYAEDTARDDLRGPAYDPATCTGVAP